ncbi:MAG: transketolase [Candidatus Bathyarchaeia archaeon]|nr:transketolase [Candidatus Bathyarchaeota archaeon]
MSHDEALIKMLEAKAKSLRKIVIDMMKISGQGWLGGSFSMAEIIASLLFHHMRHNPKDPMWPCRDRLILSKAHCCEIYYAALGEAGYFSREYFSSYGRFGGLLQAHSQRTVPGVDYSGGSLGMGLSFAVGEALAARIGLSTDLSGGPTPKYRVYCIIGDGECDEGQIWEAAMSASHFKLDNLIVILDRNMYQSTGPVCEVMNIEPLADKWRSFGWVIQEVDGHNIGQILDALDFSIQVKEKPSIIIANTVKGKGIPSLEGRVHFITITDEIYREAMEHLK